MKKLQRDTFKLGWMDFGLSALASCLACYSIGMGLRVPEVSWFFCIWIGIGTFVSLGLSRLIPERHTWVSGLIYSVMAVGSVAYVQPLNAMLPKGGFPFQLIIAASLAWMLVFGSFLTWRDSTIVFQAVPSIALFGLVGAWDTFSGAPFAFFGFLLCFATLFARAHGRAMMSQAAEAGFSGERELQASDSDTTVYERLKRGPWRWMAGPEWALGSAAGIVLLSVLGAPVLQTSVQGVAGFVKIQVPAAAPTVSAAAASFNLNRNGDVYVGQGPRPTLSLREVFRVKLSYAGGGAISRPMYLRARTYDQYTGRGWRPIGDFISRADLGQAMRDNASFMNRSFYAIDPFRSVQFEYEFRENTPDGVPLPGELEYVASSNSFVRRPDGSMRPRENQNVPPVVNGEARVRIEENEPVRANRDVPEVYKTADLRVIPDRVRQLAAKVTGGVQGDYAKAMAIKREIETRTQYSLDAPPVPSSSDPVEWFLFEGKIGYCDLYATSMTVMARSIGLPARYVTGYFPALGQRDRDKRWILHQSEAHAWCEIFFEGHGWVPFDATEGAVNVGQPVASEPLFERGWFRATGFTVVGLSIVLAPFFMSAYLRRKRGPIARERLELGRQYQKFVKALESTTGKPKRPSQTPWEYLEAVTPLLTTGQGEAKRLTDRFVAELYAPGVVSSDPGTLGSLRNEVTATIKAVRGK